MNQVRQILPPDLPSPTSKNEKPEENRSLGGLPSSTANNVQQRENCGFEGVATNVRQLLKLINDHKTCLTRANYERDSHRVAGMITIIDEVKSRIQTIQSSRRSVAEFRRCNSELNPNIKQPAVSIPRERRKPPPLDLGATVDQEKERLRRELTSSLVARKSLQAMCSSLSQEKQKLASALARKAQEVTEMEDYIEDLKALNDTLAEKIQARNSEHHERSDSEVENLQELQEHNEVLTEQLQKSTEGYRSLKREVKGKEEENLKINATIEEMKVEVETSLHRIRDFKEQMGITNQETNNIKDDISALEHMLESLSMKISRKKAQEN